MQNKNTFQILIPKGLTQNIFDKKKYLINILYKKSEKTLGELFCFFTLEVILLSKLLRVNPLDQPEVELVKKETFNILKH